MSSLTRVGFDPSGYPVFYHRDGENVGYDSKSNRYFWNGEWFSSEATRVLEFCPYKLTFHNPMLTGQGVTIRIVYGAANITLYGNGDWYQNGVPVFGPPSDVFGESEIPETAVKTNTKKQTGKPIKVCKESFSKTIPSSSLSATYLEEQLVAAKREISLKFREWPRCVNDSYVEHQLLAVPQLRGRDIDIVLKCPKCHANDEIDMLFDEGV